MQVRGAGLRYLVLEALPGGVRKGGVVRVGAVPQLGDSPPRPAAQGDGYERCEDGCPRELHRCTAHRSSRRVVVKSWPNTTPGAGARFAPTPGALPTADACGSLLCVGLTARTRAVCRPRC